MSSFLLIGLGGAFGAICRYALGLFVTSRTTSAFPLGTWIINISGSFLLGVIFNLYLHEDWLMLLAGIGFCGAYTTFSTFGNETVQLIVQHKLKLALLYVVASTVVSILAASLGFIIVS
ncbi:fluoride efflux transporter CrcB [Bacillus sp. B15-48]|uniref:fluoride efflux transporter CrcB n=1 Tax=Bacillus sp. B15-48 TaxID=1548601 RepID=UPI00193FB809|nr:fluoride efflux transporter CrcB [Bacillus sp. B15-48]MBM4761487.1 fluoride efflux transporter CrcB [Bacillus sp. B15-48]